MMLTINPVSFRSSSQMEVRRFSLGLHRHWIRYDACLRLSRRDGEYVRVPIIHYSEDNQTNIWIGAPQLADSTIGSANLLHQSIRKS